MSPAYATKNSRPVMRGFAAPHILPILLNKLFRTLRHTRANPSAK